MATLQELIQQSNGQEGGINKKVQIPSVGARAGADQSLNPNSPEFKRRYGAPGVNAQSAIDKSTQQAGANQHAPHPFLQWGGLVRDPDAAVGTFKFGGLLRNGNYGDTHQPQSSGHTGIAQAAGTKSYPPNQAAINAVVSDSERFKNPTDIYPQQQGGPAIPGPGQGPGLGQGATPTDKFRTQTKSHGERLYGYLPKNAAEVGEYGLASYSNRQGGATLQGFDEDISKHGLTSLAPSYMGMSSEQEANLPLDQRVARSQGGLGTARAAMAQYQQGSLKDIEEMRAQVSAGLGAHQQEMQQVKQQRMMAKLQSMMQTPLGQKEVAKMAQKVYEQAMSDAGRAGFSGPAKVKFANERVSSFWQGVNQAGQNQGRVTESAADVLGGISVGAQRNRSDAALAQQESASEQYNANQQLERDKALETHKANLPGKNRGLSEKEIEKEKLDIRKRLALGEFSIEEAEALEAAIESVSGGSGGIGGQSTNPSASAYIKNAMESGATDAQARAAAKEQIANGRLQDDLS